MSHTVGDERVIDLDKALERLDGDRDFLLELFSLFEEDGPARFESLTRAKEAGDLAAAAKAAHSLKGMSGTMSSPRLTDLAYDMEKAAKAGETDRLETSWTRFRALLAQAMVEIELFKKGG